MGESTNTATFRDVAAKYKEIFKGVEGNALSVAAVYAGVQRMDEQTFKLFCTLVNQLEDEHDAVCQKFDKEWFAITQDFMDMNKVYLLYSETRGNKALALLDSKKRFLQPTYDLSEVPAYGSQYSMSDFIDMCKSGGFVNSDGFGRYLKEGKETDIDVYPSDVVNFRNVRKDMDGIVWYNK